MIEPNTGFFVTALVLLPKPKIKHVSCASGWLGLRVLQTVVPACAAVLLVGSWLSVPGVMDLTFKCLRLPRGGGEGGTLKRTSFGNPRLKTRTSSVLNANCFQPHQISSLFSQRTQSSYAQFNFASKPLWGIKPALRPAQGSVKLDAIR